MVAVLDTGVGEHPWLGEDFVTTQPEVLGQVDRPAARPTAAEQASGVSDAMIGELEPDSGHGTFIAGLVRQACPDALILDIRLFGNSGVVAESELLRSLQLLALRQVPGRLNGEPDLEPVDVVTMSLGYYHEQPEDTAFDALLARTAPRPREVRRGGGRVRRQRRLAATDLPGGLRALPGRCRRGRRRASSR